MEATAQLTKPLVGIACALGILNLWFLFESYQVSKLEKKDPLSKLPAPSSSSQARELHPIHGSIYKIYASTRALSMPGAFEMHVVADISDAPRLLKYVRRGEISHIMVLGALYRISYKTTDVKDACMDFLKDRCDVLSNAELLVNVYSMQKAFDLKTNTMPLSEDLTENHIWVMRL